MDWGGRKKVKNQGGIFCSEHTIDITQWLVTIKCRHFLCISVNSDKSYITYKTCLFKFKDYHYIYGLHTNDRMNRRENGCGLLDALT